MVETEPKEGEKPPTESKPKEKPARRSSEGAVLDEVQGLKGRLRRVEDELGLGDEDMAAAAASSKKKSRKEDDNDEEGEEIDLDGPVFGDADIDAAMRGESKAKDDEDDDEE